MIFYRLRKRDLFYVGTRLSEEADYMPGLPREVHRFEADGKKALLYASIVTATQLAKQLGAHVEMVSGTASGVKVKDTKFPMRYTQEELSADRIKLANTIREYAKWRGITLAQVASELQISTATIHHMPKPQHNMRWSYIADLAKRLCKVVAG